MQPEPTLSRGDYRESLRIGAILRKESVGGALLVLAAAGALIAANTAGDWYFGLRELHLGFEIPEFLDLNLSVAHWAADGLLAVFFLLVGLELKHEFVAGDLRNFRTAVVPITAAFGGVAVPALAYLSVNFLSAAPEPGGWAIPAATDIAFALAVLALVGTHLPAAMRTFLMTLAVVDDLIAILIIAFVYPGKLQLGWLALALLPLAAFWLLTHRGKGLLEQRWWAWPLLLLPLAAAVWVCVYASGIHATIAGVLLGFAIPVGGKAGPGPILEELVERGLRPVSAAFAVPVFAFFAAGVAVPSLSALWEAALTPVGLGVIIGLVVGKVLGIAGTTWLVTRLRGATLDPDIAWVDVVGLGLVGGIGFTVSLLVGELAFRGGPNAEPATLGVLIGSALAACLAAVFLAARNRHYRRVEEEEALDADSDGIPDKFQH